MKRTRMKPGAPPTYAEIKARPRSTYRKRQRDTPRMLFVKTMICSVIAIPPPWISVWEITPCSGVIEADHMGARGVGRKAPDDTCAPLCTGHHRERTDHTGTFKHVTKAEEREWREVAIERARDQYASHAVRAAPNH